MSYSFSVKAASKAAALAAVAAKFDEDVVKHMPVHARDRDAVLANAANVVGILADDDTKDVTVSINGYVSWQTPEPQDVVPLTYASISASAGHVNRE